MESREIRDRNCAVVDSHDDAVQRMGPVVLFATVSPDYPEGAALIPGALVNNIGLGGVAPADVW